MQRWIKEGGDVNSVAEGGVNLLQWLTWFGPKGHASDRHTAFTVLLDAGADAEHTDNDGRSVLHYAAVGDDTWYLETLLTRGVDPDVTDGAGQTPLHNTPPSTNPDATE